jgi:hypothetical protein
MVRRFAHGMSRKRPWLIAAMPRWRPIRDVIGGTQASSHMRCTTQGSVEAFVVLA